MREGIWSPDAGVRCADCNNALVGRAHWAKNLPARDVEPTDDDAVTTCDDCGCEVATDRDVGSLHALRGAIGRGAMEQTGGMCSAFVVREHGVCILITDDEEAPAGRFAVGSYLSSDDDAYGESFDMEDNVALADVPATVERMISEARASLAKGV